MANDEVALAPLRCIQAHTLPTPFLNIAKSRDLVAQVEALELAARRITDERNAALLVKDNQHKLISRQEETIVELVSRMGKETPIAVRVGREYRTPNRIE